MADEVLKNTKGITIGKISTGSNGIKIIKDPKGITKGTYDPKTNKTKDPRGITVGEGNQLVSLL